MAVKGLTYRISLRLAGWAYFVLSRLLFASCRISMGGEGAEFYAKRLTNSAPVIVAFWHYGVILFPFLSRGGKWVAMVSASKDGEYIARILESMGHVTVRGSKNRQGVSALKKMIEIMTEGRNAVLVADGSQGPPRKVQPGGVLLAAHSGCPILPVSWSASAYWTFRSWDRTVLPKPFSRIEVLIGPPLSIPRQSRGAGLETHRRQLEQELDKTYCEAWRRMGKTEH